MRGQYKLQSDLKEAVKCIGGILKSAGKCEENPTGIVSDDIQYYGDRFAIRAFKDTPLDHKPNFQYKELLIDWHNDISKGHSQNVRYVSPKNIVKMIVNIVKEIEERDAI